MVVMVRCCRSGRQFLFSDKIINPVFNNVLVDGSEIFVNFSFREVLESCCKLPKQQFMLSTQLMIPTR